MGGGRRRRLLSAALAASLLGACSPASLYRSGFETTQGAMDAVRRSQDGLLDRDALHDAVAAAMSGVRLSEDLRRDVNQLSAAAVTGAMGALATGVNAVLLQVRQQLLALIDAIDSPLARLTRTELAAIRGELRATIRDVDEGLQLLLQHNARVLGEELRTSIGRAVNESLAENAGEVGRRAGFGFAQGLGRGLRTEVAPATRDLRHAILPDTDGLRRELETTRTRGLWIIGGLAAVIAGLGVAVFRQRRGLATRMVVPERPEKEP